MSKISRKNNFKTKLKKLIVEKISEVQGCKALELVAILGDVDFKKYRLPNLLDELVAEGEVLEFRYSPPKMLNRIKSFYLPKGTVLAGTVLEQPLEPPWMPW